MPQTKSFTDLAKLEWYQVALTNARTKPELNQSLNEIGVSNDILGEGSNLLVHAGKIFNDADIAKINRNEAYMVYGQLSDELEKCFSTDRKRANIAFLNNPLAKEKLELGRKLEQNRLKQFIMSKTFYSVLSKNAELQEAVAKLGLTAEIVSERLALVSKLEEARTAYIFEKGISQNATKEKKKAMNTLTKWMTRFFAISRDAFKDEPQMMESLGWVVK